MVGVDLWVVVVLLVLFEVVEYEVWGIWVSLLHCIWVSAIGVVVVMGYWIEVVGGSGGIDGVDIDF